MEYDINFLHLPACTETLHTNLCLYTVYLHKTIITQAKTFTVSAWKSLDTEVDMSFVLKKENLNAQNST